MALDESAVSMPCPWLLGRKSHIAHFADGGQWHTAISGMYPEKSEEQDNLQETYKYKIIGMHEQGN